MDSYLWRVMYTWLSVHNGEGNRWEALQRKTVAKYFENKSIAFYSVARVSFKCRGEIKFNHLAYAIQFDWHKISKN